MTGFENKGCELQMECDSVYQAVKAFEYSCKVCCAKGVRVTCDRCAIAAVHENVVSAIRDFEDERRHKEAQRAQAQRLMTRHLFQAY